MKKVFTLFILLGTMLAACHQKQPTKNEPTEPIHTHKNMPGDSTLYGLACEGCTDSLLILLPFSGGDPDTFDIINAFQSRHIYGRPRIGDELGVILNVWRFPISVFFHEADLFGERHFCLDFGIGFHLGEFEKSTNLSIINYSFIFSLYIFYSLMDSPMKIILAYFS